MNRRIIGRLLSATVTHALIFLCLSCLVSADPLPMEEMYAGGRIMPAEQVPVDMTSETLRVTMNPLDRDRPYAIDSPLCIAHVSARYDLQADRALTVPVLFPVIGTAGEMAFTVNGGAVEPWIVRDADLFAAYSPVWRATIDAFIESDRRLSEIVREAMPEIEADRKRRAEDENYISGDVTKRLWGQFERRLPALGLPTDLNWHLAHYVKDDWSMYARGSFPGHSPYAAARHRMWAERKLALAIDPDTPDPVALWTPPAETNGFTSMFFAAAELKLREGRNDLEVTYRQPVSFLNRPPVERTREMESSHMQVCQFDFVLQTARFWRSFGGLDCTIELPKGTVQAECNLPGAKVTLGDQPRVTLSASGLPGDNIRLQFASKKWREEQDSERQVAEQVPEVRLQPVWEDAIEVEDAHNFANMPPLLDGDRLVAASGNRLVVYDIGSGQRLAEFMLEGDVDDVAVFGDRLLIGFGGEGSNHKSVAGIALADLRSKALEWTYQAQDGRHAAPATQVVRIGDTAVGWANRGSVLAADLGSGGKLWEVSFAARGADTDGKRLYVCGSPDTSNGDHEDSTRSSVMALDTRTGKKLWETPVGYWALGLCADGSRILAVTTPTRADDPELIALRASDGSVQWRKDFGEVSSNAIHEMVPLDDGTLTVVDDHGISNWAIDGTPRENWRVNSHYQMLEPPRIVDGKACVLMREGLGNVDVRSGETEWLVPEEKMRGPHYVASGETIAKVERIGGAVVCLKPASDAGDEPVEVPLAGTVPSDLASRVLSVPAAGWLPMDEFALYREDFEPSGGLAPDNSEYVINGRDVEVPERARAEVEEVVHQRVEDAATEWSGRRIVATVILSLVAVALIGGAIIWRRNGA